MSEMSEEFNGLSRELFSILDVSFFFFRIGLFLRCAFQDGYLGIFIASYPYFAMGIFWNFLDDFLEFPKSELILVMLKRNSTDSLYYLLYYLSYKTFIDHCQK